MNKERAVLIVRGVTLTRQEQKTTESICDCYGSDGWCNENCLASAEWFSGDFKNHTSDGQPLI